ncbi:MAG TPA: hypothetical protein PKN13_09920 [Accumulibacter sp.]|nr:hypothetical protein [Accumulibacter sp.]HNM75642.1 hypothetical protein [Accumulibacter sp.]
MMKIDHAVVAMSTSHDHRQFHQTRYRELPAFRNIFNELPAAPALSPATMEKERLRLVSLIAGLLTRMLAVLAGRQDVTGNTPQVRWRTDVEEAGEPIHADERRRSWQISWQAQKSEVFHESESSDFTAHGLIFTADGRSLDFSLDLSLERDYLSATEQGVGGLLKLRDPLVVNFAGAAVQLAGKRFAFDLDQDGIDETMPQLGTGSAYLVIDHDSNGRITDGGELFGSVSGDGFADLARFDDDGNRWIDEADAAFAKLRLWSGGDEPQALRTLAEQGIGALYLGSVSTPFTLTDAANRTLAQIRASGLFLHESGTVGSLQQVDFVV